ncbi:hypothetical protein FRC03_005789 [Tulasnella sp. 419]|nr:hypothetical protein FRC02_006578 [Tulasnella sp. 418]KAG8961093.1 hypothetical protein FRC03_005789 [Tulasnella sp. 419]
MEETTITAKAILFDMDGTLIDSTAGVVGAWEYFAKQYPGLDVKEIIRTSHGVRTIDNLKKWCPDIPADELEDAVTQFEIEIVNSARRNEEEGRTGIVLLPGAKELIDIVGDSGWAICTSAALTYATAALETVGIPIPPAFVVAEDVPRGKPFPDPYLLGAEKCGVDIAQCIVFEDAPSGVASGKAAGAKVIAVCTSHSRERMEQTEPDYLVDDLTWVTMRKTGDSIVVGIRKPSNNQS